MLQTKDLPQRLSPLHATLTKNKGVGPSEISNRFSLSPIFRTLFQVPYPLTPLFATHTKTAGCVPKIPILVYPERRCRRVHPERVVRRERGHPACTDPIPELRPRKLRIGLRTSPRASPFQPSTVDCQLLPGAHFDVTMPGGGPPWIPKTLCSPCSTKPTRKRRGMVQTSSNP